MKKKHLLITLILTLCFTITLTATVFGANDVRQSDIYSNKIAVTFTKPSISSGTFVRYDIYLRTDDGDKVKSKNFYRPEYDKF